LLINRLDSSDGSDRPREGGEGRGHAGQREKEDRGDDQERLRRGTHVTSFIFLSFLESLKISKKKLFLKHSAFAT
jgi:hypothetical protein